MITIKNYIKEREKKKIIVYFLFPFLFALQCDEKERASFSFSSSYKQLGHQSNSEAMFLIFILSHKSRPIPLYAICDCDFSSSKCKIIRTIGQFSTSFQQLNKS